MQNQIETLRNDMELVDLLYELEEEAEQQLHSVQRKYKPMARERLYGIHRLIRLLLCEDEPRSRS
jgi:hypothetical protein